MGGGIGGERESGESDGDGGGDDHVLREIARGDGMGWG